MAGLLARGYAPFPPSQSGFASVDFEIGKPLTVAGAATVLAPIWVIRTVFPFHFHSLGERKTIASLVVADFGHLCQCDFMDHYPMQKPLAIINGPT